MSRETLHRLVEELPEADVPTAERMLAGLRATADPLLLALQSVPYDDEPDDDDADGGLTEAREQVERGEVVSHEEVKRRLGIE